MLIVINVMTVPPILDHQNQEKPESQIDSQDRRTLNHLKDIKGTLPLMRGLSYK